MRNRIAFLKHESQRLGPNCLAPAEASERGVSRNVGFASPHGLPHVDHAWILVRPPQSHKRKTLGMTLGGPRAAVWHMDSGMELGASIGEFSVFLAGASRGNWNSSSGGLFAYRTLLSWIRALGQ